MNNQLQVRKYVNQLKQKFDENKDDKSYPDEKIYERSV